MSKVASSYGSVILGVSQQVPQDRREGQHHEQVNMISDPVKGLVRRRGSEFEDEKIFADYIEEFDEATVKDTRSFKSLDFLVGEDQFTILYRSKQKTLNSQAPFAWCFNRNTRKFLNVSLTSGSMIDKLVNDGCNAIVNTGRFLYLSPSNHIPTNSTDDRWGSVDNLGKGVIWVRLGSYSRMFTSRLRLRKVSDNSIVTLNSEYLTKAASYPGFLDTSDILTSDPDYQKKVNDRRNEYDSLVTAWIGESAADIVASNIANKLKVGFDLDLITKGLTPSDIVFTISNSSIGIRCSSDFVIDELSVSDSGDETMIRGVGHTIESIDKLVPEHFPDKIVRVLPKKADKSDGFYEIAIPRSNGFVLNQLTEVSWQQTAGTVTELLDVFCFATVENNTLYISGSAQDLQAASGITDVPGFSKSEVGDLITSPLPHFLGRRINYLGMFQDRLVVGSGSILLFSRPGDYLNFFRKDVLTVIDTDPIEIYSLGSEDDIIVSSTVYDKSLVLFGQRKQYFLNGRNILTPRTSSITQLSSHEDAMDANPVSSGNFAFYGKYRNGVTTLHQLQTGYVQDSPESYELSQQLSTYIKGKPLELKALTTPNNIILRTDGDTNLVYIYTYLDSQDGQQRHFDSWSKWSWDKQLGHLLGWSYRQGDLSLITIRKGKNTDGVVKWFAVSDRFVFDSDLTNKPCLDSMRKYNNYVSADNTKWLNPEQTNGMSNVYVSFDNTVREFMLGQTLETVSNLVTAYPTKLDSLWIGFGYDSFVTPTNPYMRDNKERTIVNGRLIVNKYTISVADTGGVRFEIEAGGGEPYISGDYNGRTLSRKTAELGIQPIVSSSVNMIVNRENTEFKFSIRSRDWLPLTVTSIEYTGQYFSNIRRV